MVLSIFRRNKEPSEQELITYKMLLLIEKFIELIEAIEQQQEEIKEMMKFNQQMIASMSTQTGVNMAPMGG